MKNDVASVPAARYSGPSQPIMMTSVVNSAFWATCATTSGQASRKVARSSAAQPGAVRIVSVVFMFWPSQAAPSA